MEAVHVGGGEAGRPQSGVNGGARTRQGRAWEALSLDENFRQVSKK